MGEMIQEQRLNVLAAEIKLIKEEVRRTALMAAIEIGKRLIEIKGYLPHGAFGNWLREHVDYSERDAQRMMQLFEQYGKAGVEGVERLSISQALALLSIPEEQRRELIESGQAEDMSVRCLKEEAERYKAELAGRQQTIDSLVADLAAERGEKDRLAGLAEDAAARAKRELEEKTQLRDAKIRLEKEKSEAESRIQAALERAETAEKRAAEAEEREKEAAQPVIQQVEVAPPEMEAELERLREISAKAPDKATILAREHYQQGVGRFEAAIACLQEMEAEGRAKYAAAFAKGLRIMAERMEE